MFMVQLQLIQVKFMMILNAINGTLLPALDPDGEFFGLMTDFMGTWYI